MCRLLTNLGDERDAFLVTFPLTLILLIVAAQQSSGRRPPLLRGHMADEVLPRLYLSDLYIARDEAQLTSLGITHVVSVIERAPTLPHTQSLRTLHIPLSDNIDQDILTHLPVTTSFIGNALAEDPNSRVLVSSTSFPLFLQ
jgi:hypothetical protein